MRFAVGAAIFVACTRPSAPGPERCDNQAIVIEPSVIVVAPHPDDEVLGFAGIIDAALRLHRDVRVVIATDGQSDCKRCALWRSGRPPGPDVPACNRAELDAYGLARRPESIAALSLLGVRSDHVTFLGFDGGALARMLAEPSAGVGAPTCPGAPDASTRTTRPGAEVEASLTRLLSSGTDGLSVFTTHALDGHSDHAALHDFVHRALARTVRRARVYTTVIHNHGYRNCLYPGPPQPHPHCEPFLSAAELDAAPEDEIAVRRLARYRPRDWWLPPSDADYGHPLAFCIDRRLYDGPAPLKRTLIELYATQTGHVRQDGGDIPARYRGWPDQSGYLLAFVRRNELFYADP